jgi:hypothetical protein
MLFLSHDSWPRPFNPTNGAGLETGGPFVDVLPSTSISSLKPASGMPHEIASSAGALIATCIEVRDGIANCRGGRRSGRELHLFTQIAIQEGEISFRSALLGSRKSLSLPFLMEPSFNFKVISGGHPSRASITFSTTPTACESLWTMVSPR